ncbi:MAG: XTP/dITP diphosphatase [Desulfohalobiaceae bacterium]|nr:XTP/dITP diphosphatase [Desulfohalobiaceae bacterium]
MQIVLATRNRGKLRELSRLLQTADVNIQVLGLDSYPHIGAIEEPGSTFAENAVHKASTVCQSTGLPSLADDSGLEADALEGGPGVYSARFSGPGATDAENNRKLLSALQGVPRESRTARFRCVLSACLPGGRHLTVEGSWEGWIACEPRGANGFGYDPLFVDQASGRTAAELSEAEKNARSHRTRALQRFVRAWPAFVRDHDSYRVSISKNG